MSSKSRGHLSSQRSAGWTWACTSCTSSTKSILVSIDNSQRSCQGSTVQHSHAGAPDGSGIEHSADTAAGLPTHAFCYGSPDF